MQRTILLADDSPTIRRLVTQTFADGNFRVVEVNNGDAAIRTFEDIRPSVVLADIYMPGKNGYQVCSYVRSHPELGSTPVVLLVGAFDAFDQDSAKQAGATASITKPFEPGALIELVKSVIGPEREEPKPAPRFEPRLEPAPEPVQQPVVMAAAPAVEAPVKATPVPAPVPVEDPDDVFGLAAIFSEESVRSAAATLTEDDVDRIADRVIQRLSTQVIENIAWEIVPDITERVVRDELKRVK